MNDDESLLEAWRDGDRRAGNVLFQRHFEPVRRFFVNKVDDEATELVQRTFLRCVAAKERFEGRSSFRTFLFAIAHNVLREHYRARSRARAEDDVDEHSVVDLGAGLSTMLDDKREQRALLLALRRIPLKFQVVLELYFWEKLTGPEIGQALGIPEDTARSRIRRGKELLREALGKVAEAEVAENTGGDLDGWAEAVRAEMMGAAEIR
ncbi:RNA polymerase sigma factor [Paraliomyxa miuraensis]|uniref:RNA polymerase sigma factor n=1 Tax=Paraliomyxa miuraensis TaxID=376150 RepID=UPI00224D2CB6|nr:sigma-70 family RNA polymerase sigma factor [Paraliomyxa miuraensis]MCX4240848.1 sigma-70 family RNA polymerase sigma factor [Paraliomyxa miuraensis]